jgi:hypothetical protein
MSLINEILKCPNTVLTDITFIRGRNPQHYLQDVEATRCLDVTAITGPHIRTIAIWCKAQVLV